MQVIAKFKGKNGSRGYVTGHTYSLSFKTLTDDSGIVIQDHNRVAKVNIYNSLTAFLKNWEVIK